MPRIATEIARSAFYLYPSVEDAKSGAKFGGTGFFVGYPTGFPEVPVWLYAVTNWHVAVREGASVMRVNTTNGGVDAFDFDPSEWEFPPGGDDIAIMPFTKLPLRESLHEVVSIHLDMLVTKEEIAEYAVGPGENVMMVGRFVDHDGAASKCTRCALWQHQRDASKNSAANWKYQGELHPRCAFEDGLLRIASVRLPHVRFRSHDRSDGAVVHVVR